MPTCAWLGRVSALSVPLIYCGERASCALSFPGLLCFPEREDSPPYGAKQNPFEKEMVKAFEIRYEHMDPMELCKRINFLYLWYC